MQIAVLGAGNIGASAARHFVAAGHQVRIAGAGDMAKLEATAHEIGAVAATVADAVHDSQVVMLAVPWPAREATFAEAGAGAFTGKLVIDASNPYLEYPALDDLHGRGSSEIIAEALPGATIVKAFNTLWWDRLAHGGLPHGDAHRIALPVCGDDAAAKNSVMRLMDAIGFDSIDAGPLSNGRYQQPETPLYAQTPTLAELQTSLDARPI